MCVRCEYEGRGRACDWFSPRTLFLTLLDCAASLHFAVFPLSDPECGDLYKVTLVCGGWGVGGWGGCSTGTLTHTLSALLIRSLTFSFLLSLRSQSTATCTRLRWSTRGSRCRSCGSSTLTPSHLPTRSACCAKASCLPPRSLATTRSTSSRRVHGGGGGGWREGVYVFGDHALCQGSERGCVCVW